MGEVVRESMIKTYYIQMLSQSLSLINFIFYYQDKLHLFMEYRIMYVSNVGWLN